MMSPGQRGVECTLVLASGGVQGYERDESGLRGG